VDSTDSNTISSNYSGNVLGRNTLSIFENHNEAGYSGYAGIGEQVRRWNVRTRLLDSVLGRWTRRDPVEYEEDVNLYVFVSSAPIQRLDASGLLSILPGVGGDRVPPAIEYNLFHHGDDDKYAPLLLAIDFENCLDCMQTPCGQGTQEHCCPEEVAKEVSNLVGKLKGDGYGWFVMYDSTLPLSISGVTHALGKENPGAIPPGGGSIGMNAKMSDGGTLLHELQHASHYNDFKNDEWSWKKATDYENEHDRERRQWGHDLMDQCPKCNTADTCAWHLNHPW